MKKLLILILISLFYISNVTAAEQNGINLSIELVQVDSLHGDEYPVYFDTIQVMKDLTVSGYLGPFTIDIDLFKFDSLEASFYVHLVNSGANALTMSKQYTVEYSLPAVVDGLYSKTRNPYKFIFRPLNAAAIDTSDCSFNHNTKGEFKAQPTAYTDIFFVPGTYADYFWDSIKDLMESEYRRFKDMAKFSIPGKYSIYVYPCLSYNLIWDKRFGTMVDPNRSAAYAIYNPNANTADPFIVSHLSILKNYGYAPSFLSEGLAGYFSFAPNDMKYIIKEKNNLPLTDLLNTYNFTKADPNIADKTAATFVKFLVDTYGFANFIELYKYSDEINLTGNVQRIYNSSLAELEENWLNYVDTLTITPQNYLSYIYKADLMNNYPLMKNYCVEFFESADSEDASLEAASQLKRACFFLGEYDEAVRYQKLILDKKAENPKGWMALGSYEMMIGDYNKALNDFEKANSIDSLDININFNLALCKAQMGDTATALELLDKKGRPNPKGSAYHLQSDILKAWLLENSNSDADRAKADTLYKRSLLTLRQGLQTNNSSSSLYLWAGICYYGLGQYEDAMNYLNTAGFLETRYFYRGMINLWLGKTHIKRDEKDLAKTYLNLVIDSKSAEYNKSEAKELLKKI